MHHLYNDIELTREQKIAYIKVLSYLAKFDSYPDDTDQRFLRNALERMKLDSKSLRSAFVPRNQEELYRALIPISSRAVAIDLLHCCCFAASANSIITDEEINVIRKIAMILRIDNDTLSDIFDFVTDEVTFLQHAKIVLEAEELGC